MSAREDKRAEVVGIVALVLALLLGGCVGSCVTKRSDAEIEGAAFQRLRGEGNVPGVTEESATSEITGKGFQPSDQPPKCLPNGTVTYEVFDSAANRRYWVFRWPEDKGYSIIPRDMVDEDGNVVPYTPGYERQLTTKDDPVTTNTDPDTTGDDAVTTTGTVEVGE